VTVRVTPRPAATVMLLRDPPDPAVTGVEVLLLRRSVDTPFAPGAHVFPGGAVDPGDDDPLLDAVVDGLDDRAASAWLDVERGGRAFWVAAVRECLEEAGVLLATGADGEPIGTGHPVLDELADIRRAVERGERSLAGVCTAHGLRIPLAGLAYVSRWITPEESRRRYDTRFLAAPMPPDQQVVVDAWEAVAARWWDPTEALAAWQAGDIQLIEPTVASLGLLAEFPSVQVALDALRAGADRRERVREPAGGLRVPLPSDIRGDDDR
jgi:8-oxo-dGTP pyrophosphatase MutT (NUDIX family)